MPILGIGPRGFIPISYALLLGVPITYELFFKRFKIPKGCTLLC
jgi:hypothetical protein